MTVRGLRTHSVRKASTRIPYLAKLRNLALAPLFDVLAPLVADREPISPIANLSESDKQFLHTFTHNKHSKLVFLNDIYFEAADIARLMTTADMDYDVACGLDFYTRFYDHYVTRDLNGDFFSDHFPFVRHRASQPLARRDQWFPVYSCWNGGVSMNPAPFLEKRLQFRADVTNQSCIPSECFLICEDFRRLGYPTVLLNPNVKVTYTKVDYLFHKYLVPVYNYLLALVHFPQPTYIASNANAVYNLNVECGTPKR